VNTATRQSTLEAQNRRMRAALIAILTRSNGKLFDTDQETGKTFDEIAREAITDERRSAGLRA
jgi:hypothetical protein